MRSITLKTCQTCHPRRVPASLPKNQPPARKTTLLSTPLFPRARYFWALALLGTHTPPLSVSLNYPPPPLPEIYPAILPLFHPPRLDALTPHTVHRHNRVNYIPIRKITVQSARPTVASTVATIADIPNWPWKSLLIPPPPPRPNSNLILSCPVPATATPLTCPS